MFSVPTMELPSHTFYVFPKWVQFVLIMYFWCHRNPFKKIWPWLRRRVATRRNIKLGAIVLYIAKATVCCVDFCFQMKAVLHCHRVSCVALEVGIVSACLIVKVVAQKGCSDKLDAVIGQIGRVSHHLESLLGAFESIILCAFVCRVGYFNAQIRETLLYK